MSKLFLLKLIDKNGKTHMGHVAFGGCSDNLTVEQAAATIEKNNSFPQYKEVHVYESRAKGTGDFYSMVKAGEPKEPRSGQILVPGNGGGFTKAIPQPEHPFLSAEDYQKIAGGATMAAEPSRFETPAAGPSPEVMSAEGGKGA